MNTRVGIKDLKVYPYFGPTLATEPKNMNKLLNLMDSHPNTPPDRIKSSSGNSALIEQRSASS